MDSTAANNVLNVFYASSKVYLPMAYTSICSLFENVSTKLNIFFLYTDIEELQLQELKKNVEQKGHCINFIEGNCIFKKLEEKGVPTYHGSYMNLVKVYVATVTQVKFDRVLWIDCDTIVTGDIKFFFDINLDDKPIAMCCDTMRPEYKKSVGVKKSEPYYNSGIVLFNMKEWNAAKCEQRVEDYLKNKKSNFVLAEQDLFNVVLKREIFKLPCKCNYITPMIMHDYKQVCRVYNMNEDNFYTEEQYEEAKNNPLIVHYAGDGYGRPWLRTSTHPYKDIFCNYMRGNNIFGFDFWNKKIPLHYRVQRWAKEKLTYNLFTGISWGINWCISVALTVKNHK